MTVKQKLELKLSTARTALNELAGLDSPTEAQVTEMDTAAKGYKSLETQYRSAVIAEGDAVETERPSSPEARELRSLIARSDIFDVALATIEHRETNGATAELQQHFDLAPNMVPLELFRDIETRAVTTSPTDVGQQQEGTLPPVFADGLGAFLQIYRPVVGVGDATYPVLTTRPVVRGPHKDSTSAAETNGNFDAETLEPERLQASFFWRRTDAARLKGMGDTLRDALRRGLQEKLDAQLSAQIVTDTTRVDATAADTFSTALSRYAYSRVDGRYAASLRDIRLAVGSETFADWGGLFSGTNAGDLSLVDRLGELTGGLSVNPHAAVASGSKQDTLIRLGSRRDIVQPTWNGVALIPDEISKADTGEIKLSAIMLANVKVIRDEGILRIQSQHA